MRGRCALYCKLWIIDEEGYMTEQDIMNIIEEEDVEFIRLQFTDIFGSLKNMAVTPGQMEKVFAGRYSFDGSAMFGNEYYTDERFYLYPDADSFTILPWRPQQGKVAKIVCDVCREDGAPFELSPRTILRRTLQSYAKQGFSFKADPECEFFLFHTDEFGLPTTLTHEKGGYMDVGPLDFGENARRDIVLMLEELGFDIKASFHESAPAQHVIEFHDAEAMKMADDIQTFRFAVRSVAKRFGLYATFMPKPRENVAGSAMHTNFSVYENGDNAFKDDDGKITREAEAFAHGLMKHAKAIAAIACPTVNSYKRLAAGFPAPQFIDFAFSGERSLVRINSDKAHVKVEFRLPDGSSNPYTLFACCIAAGIDGINDMRLNRESDTTEKTQERLPDNLKEAVMALEEDELIKNILGSEFTGIYSRIKMKEWESYMTSVSEWEINRYLGRF